MKLELSQRSLIKRPWIMASIVLSFICMIIMMIAFNYTDADPYISWSIELLDCIFKRTDYDFYYYTTLNLRSLNESLICCDKTIPMMLPISLWNIPVWIVHQITGEMIVTGFWEIVWMKMGFLACIVLTATQCSKIVKIVSPESDHLLVYPLIFASFDIMCSTMYASQDEIIYLLFLVLALRFMVTGKTIWFLVFSSFSVALNPLMLIPVLLMIVYYEKRIRFILLYLIVSYIPTELFTLLYRNNETYHRYTLMQPSIIKSLFSMDIGLVQGNGNVSLYLLTVLVLLFCAYIWNRRNKEPKDVLWLMAALMTSMTLLSSGGLLNFFYRSLLYVPFLAVLLVSSKQNGITNLILYGLYSWSRGWLCIITDFPQNMNTAYIFQNNEYTQRIVNKAGYLVLGKYYGEKIPMLLNYGVITTICLAVAVILLFINYKNRQEHPVDTIKMKKDVLVFLVGLFVPLIIVAFQFMFINSDSFRRLARFGSEYEEYNENELQDICYLKNNGIAFYRTQIVYDDMICLMNGEDVDGLRYLYPEGVSFGPYLKLYPGEYTIRINGQNLGDITYDCTYNDGGMPYNIPIEVTESSEEVIAYRIVLQEETENIETRIFNNSDNTVTIESIDIIEVR